MALKLLGALELSGGNVGIGTSSPSEALHIYRNAASAEIRLQNNTISSYIRSNTDNLNFYVSNGEKMRITSGGNVGIGTTSPGNKLEVVGSNAVRIHDGTDQGSIFFRGDRDDVYIKESNYQLLFGSPSGMVFELDTNLNNGDLFNITHRGTSRFYVNGTNGNVGIGTTSPGYTLDVNGSMHSTNITIADAIYHEGDTNTSISFGTDAINLNTGGSGRINITDSTTKVNNDLIIAGGETLSLGERAEADDNGRTVLIEGVAGGSSGEGSGRIFFTEHNSTTAAADKYGLSLYYEGDPNALLPSGFQPNTGNATWSLRRHDNSVNGAAIMSGSRSNSNVTFSGTVNVGASLTIPEYIYHNGDSNTYVRFTADRIRIVAGGSTKFDSNNTYLLDVTPAAPSVTATNIVGETIEITFSQSSTADVDYYQVWSAVGSSTGSYGMIAHVPQEDVASSMTVIDATFSVSDTMYYRVYAVKSGIYSTAGTANRAFSAAALDVANMSVVNLNTAYYIQYEMPDSRFVDHVEIYMDAETTASNLTRTGATLVYSGNNTSYMYKIGANDLNKYHQFWVEVIES